MILLLPERRRFSGQPISPRIAAALGRADRPEEAAAGERPQLLRYFDLLPSGWPMAALTREADVGDASLDTWLRADPVYVRPDLGGARLMAWGNLGLSAAEAETFLAPLRPVFEEVGMPISATAPERWYLRLPREMSLPAFTPPAEGLGEDLLAHLPQGADGRRWRKLLNEAQVTLHNHPRNLERAAAGLMPVNSLWFWGGGVLPDSVTCSAACVISEDHELLALARQAGASLARRETGSTVIDLRRMRDWAALEREHLVPALASLERRHGELLLDFADGASFRIEAAQRWRFWRRPIKRLDP
ncbi:MAG: phosphoglycerate mutase [Arenimonas sp.]|nr:phosphoglycerate mutase [Arenimonas sp.]